MNGLFVVAVGAVMVYEAWRHFPPILYILLCLGGLAVMWFGVKVWGEEDEARDRERSKSKLDSARWQKSFAEAEARTRAVQRAACICPVWDQPLNPDCPTHRDAIGFDDSGALFPGMVYPCMKCGALRDIQPHRIGCPMDDDPEALKTRKFAASLRELREGRGEERWVRPWRPQ